MYRLLDTFKNCNLGLITYSLINNNSEAFRPNFTMFTVLSREIRFKTS